ncbi:hypothetical protein Dimus_017556, partial [Dionaea muscipula]
TLDSRPPNRRHSKPVEERKQRRGRAAFGLRRRMDNFSVDGGSFWDLFFLGFRVPLLPPLSPSSRHLCFEKTWEWKVGERFSQVLLSLEIMQRSTSSSNNIAMEVYMFSTVAS